MPAQVSVLNRRLTALIAAPAGQAVSDVKTFQANNTATATPNDPLTVPVKVSAALVAATARRAPGQGSGTDLLNFSVAREQAASKTRAYAFIRDIDLKNEQKSQYRVFVDCDYLSQSTPIGDKHYVGTFGFFGDHAGHGPDNAKTVGRRRSDNGAGEALWQRHRGARNPESADHSGAARTQQRCPDRQCKTSAG